jgi:hypothetical protein
LVFPSATAAASALFQQHLLTAPHPLYQQLYAAQQQHQQQQQHSIGLPVRTSSPKLPESSSSGRRGLVFPSATTASALFQQHLLAPHPLYQQLYAQHQQQQQRNRSASPVDSLPEQENPIDLSCKSSSSSPRPLCHIRAEILTGLDHDDDSLMMADDDDTHRQGDTGAPLDLTTKG